MGFNFKISSITALDVEKEFDSTDSGSSEEPSKKIFKPILPQAIQSDCRHGMTVTASSYATDGVRVFYPFKAFTKTWAHGTWRWLTYSIDNWTSEWLQIDLAVPKEISAYRIYAGFSANDQIEMDRNPKDIKLEGSLDGTNWFLLDEQKNIKQFEYLGDARTFILPRKVTYRFYKLTVLDVQGATNGKKGVHIWELEYLN